MVLSLLTAPMMRTIIHQLVFARPDASGQTAASFLSSIAECAGDIREECPLMEKIGESDHLSKVTKSWLT